MTLEKWYEGKDVADGAMSPADAGKDIYVPWGRVYTDEKSFVCMRKYTELVWDGSECDVRSKYYPYSLSGWNCPNCGHFNEHKSLNGFRRCHRCATHELSKDVCIKNAKLFYMPMECEDYDVVRKYMKDNDVVFIEPGAKIP